jgi:hypothetical protein
VLKALLFAFFAVGLVYFLFYPFLKNKVNRKLLIKWFLIVYAIAMLLATVNTYIME